MDIHHSRFDDRVTIPEIDFQDLSHPGGADHDSAADGQRPSGQTRPRTARNERNLIPIADLHDPGNLFGRGWEYDDVRNPLLDDVTVALVNQQFVGRGDQIVGPDKGTQLDQQIGRSGGRGGTHQRGLTRNEVGFPLR